MSVHQQDIGVLNFSRPAAGSTPYPAASALHQAAKHLTEQGLGRSRLKTKDVVGFLLCQGARAWRRSFPLAQPRVKAVMPNGHLAVKIRFK
jgi:ribosomal protein S11